MSAEASNWARRMKTGSPSTKALLMVLADIADHEGHIRFISTSYLMEASELGRTAIFDHLARLVAGGVFVRERDGFRKTGAPIVTGQLQLQAAFIESPTPDPSPLAGRGELQPEGSPPDGLPSAENEGGQSATRTGGSPPGGLPPYINNTRETIHSPPPPPDRRNEDAIEKRDEAEMQNFVEAFAKVYPVDATTSFEALRREAERLAPKDRERALRAAEIYAKAASKRGAGVLQASVWLSRRRFEDVERAEAAAERTGVSRVFVARGTPAWDAWASAGHKPTLISEHQGKTGWWFPTLFPPRSTGPPIEDVSALADG